MINANWLSRYYTDALHNPCSNIQRLKRIRFMQDEIAFDHAHLKSLVLEKNNNEKHTPCKQNQETCSKNSQSKKRAKEQSNDAALRKITENLHYRAQRKITRIASWNVNNGFDHLAIATIMAKNDIDILAIQEPRISASPKDDAWISNMRKELRKCKYELLTSHFSYLIFDEQTSGTSLASIIRYETKIQGRLLSVTFKSDDIWEVHTVISLYAVTNPTSTQKYAHSRSSRKDINTKVTKTLLEEINFLRETYGEAPIIVIGDFQDTVFADKRDNIGTTGKPMKRDGPLQLLINEGFTSAYHSLNPNIQQVTHWNSSKTAGRHIDLQMMNTSAASLLHSSTIGSPSAQNLIKSDHLIVIADYNITKK